jgi:hypothetical protein
VGDVKDKVMLVGCTRQSCRPQIGPGGEHEGFCYVRNFTSIISRSDDKTKLKLDDGWYVRASARENQGAHVSYLTCPSRQFRHSSYKPGQDDPWYVEVPLLGLPR